MLLIRLLLMSVALWPSAVAPSAIQVVDYAGVSSEYNNIYREVTPLHGGIAMLKFDIYVDEAMRLHVHSGNATMCVPLHIVFVEHSRTTVALLPAKNSDGSFFNDVERTLCAFHCKERRAEKEMRTVFVLLSSEVQLDYVFSARKVDDFSLEVNRKVNATVSGSRPVIFEFDFDRPDHSHLERIIIQIEAPKGSTECMVASIHDSECPSFDSENNVIGGRKRHKMITTASITVKRLEYDPAGKLFAMKRFYVVLEVHPDVSECTREVVAPSNNDTRPTASKVVNVTVQAVKIPHGMDYLLPMLAALGFFAVIIAIAGCPLWCLSDSTQFFDLQQDSTAELPAQSSDRGECSVKEVNEHNLAQYSEKDFNEREVAFQLYIWIFTPASMLYCLPVVQLLFYYLFASRKSGNEDICFYNFRCARPFWVFHVFNNIYSNVGYIIVGFAFLHFVYYRGKSCTKLCVEYENVVKKACGVPRHNAILYSIGISFMLEGIFSGYYHMCPSRRNYQFDTTFMIVISMLGIIAVYEKRHPDATPRAEHTFALAVVVVFTIMFGVFLKSIYFWLVFTFFYVVIYCFISSRNKELDEWRAQVCRCCKSERYSYVQLPDDSVELQSVPLTNQPILTEEMRASGGRKTRLFFGFLADLFNFIIFPTWSLAVRPDDFGSHLLLPFFVNLGLYTVYYILMKISCDFRCLKQHYNKAVRWRGIARNVILGVFALLTGILSYIFFQNHATEWSYTPAHSRELNQPCLLMDFYDSHDIWHFLSAAAMLFGFSILIDIDNDLIAVPRDQIDVF